MSFLAFSAKPISRNSVHDNGFQFLCRVRSSKTTADMDEAEEERIDLTLIFVHLDRMIFLFVPRNYALRRCFDVQCGWAGQVFADTKKPHPGVNLRGKINSSMPLTEESLRLEMLGDEKQVEGEIDKLSVEESGYYHCVGVPGCAPQTVSNKELPSLEKDMSFQYLWNCKDYLDKASRIIMATDGDIPGQALAEELSLPLGR